MQTWIEHAYSVPGKAMTIHEKKFGGPPLLFRSGEKERLVAIIEDAVEAEQPLMMDDLIRAQGGKPAPRRVRRAQ